MKIKKNSLLLMISFCAFSCVSKVSNCEKVASIQIIDRNGFNETISNKERIEQLKKVNFMERQPYEKVVRVYSRSGDGKIHSKLTMYHVNGELWKYLDVVNGRANGIYKEWYDNGKLRMFANVIEGIGDLTDEASITWVFDKKSMVWDENGAILAEIIYDKGQLADKSSYFHPNGVISKLIPYKKNKIDGQLQIFNFSGELVGATNYVNGVKNGLSNFIGSEYLPSREEEYQRGLLMNGKYCDFTGELISEIINGYGVKSIFENTVLRIEQEYTGGAAKGLVKTYRENGNIESKYTVFNNQKQGEEWFYYDKKNKNDEPKPMLCINWKDDEIHGLVRTWYASGALESEKEMAYNKKEGLFVAWYENTSLMMIEEYKKDLLNSGKYFKNGSDTPVSRVINGCGLATIYDKDGVLIRSIEYKQGLPVE